MDNFKEVAHKTVAELFDMLKEKQYTVDALTEIGHEKQQVIDNLKAQLECCRKENAVLLGKVGELEKTNISLEAELTSSRNYGDKLNERIRKVSWLLGNNSFERTIKNCLKILRGAND